MEDNAQAGFAAGRRRGYYATKTAGDCSISVPMEPLEEASAHQREVASAAVQHFYYSSTDVQLGNVGGQCDRSVSPGFLPPPSAKVTHRWEMATNNTE